MGPRGLEGIKGLQGPPGPPGKQVGFHLNYLKIVRETCLAGLHLIVLSFIRLKIQNFGTSSHILIHCLLSLTEELLVVTEIFIN